MQKHTLAILYYLLLCVASFANEITPNFSNIPAGAKRVDAFTQFMAPKIISVNQTVCQQRKTLLNILKNIENKTPLTGEEKDIIQQTRLEYKLKFRAPSEANLSALLSRVNIIPISIVLAQAAVETGWGTSRFARNANNYFGEHCFEKGCGIPARKDSNVEVSKFKSINAGIESYYLMLNSRTVFEDFRKERQIELTQLNNYKISKLVKTLTMYSGIGNKYPKILMQIITKYDFKKYDTPAALCLNN